ncbi:hypothetical protein ACIQGO_22220 [Streptomyces shenzhenensis]|uniref:hypothetical protein n=1 Tax=Streptomyces shenzhenensis TaxID=943815 RepID=UPI00382477CE
MVAPDRLITPEIAKMYGVSLHTVTRRRTQHPEWLDRVDKRGRRKEYDAAAVAAVADFVRRHVERQTVTLEPERLYIAQQLEDTGSGIKAGTIGADLTRGRWPEPDDTDHGVNRRKGKTAMTAMTGRHGYQRRTEGCPPRYADIARRRLTGTQTS